MAIVNKLPSPNEKLHKIISKAKKNMKVCETHADCEGAQALVCLADAYK